MEPVDTAEPIVGAPGTDLSSITEIVTAEAARLRFREVSSAAPPGTFKINEPPVVEAEGVRTISKELPTATAEPLAHPPLLPLSTRSEFENPLVDSPKLIVMVIVDEALAVEPTTITA